MENELKIMLKSKIHHARVSETQPSYVGSIFINTELMKKSNISKFEKVEVINIDNGYRWETYAVPTDEPGCISVRGGGARLCVPGDTLIILAYSITSNTHINPKMILVNKDNTFKQYITINK